jgi:hypothetical protein
MAKEKRIFIIRSNGPKNEAVNAILELEYDPLHEVIIQEYKKDRSLSQNALYWVWCTHISKITGETKDEVHERLKGAHLVKIYERDNPDYAKIIQTVREIWKSGNKKDAEFLHKEIVRLTSTTDANVAQFTEYLNDIENAERDNNIILPHPEDHYYTAMGIKQ